MLSRDQKRFLSALTAENCVPNRFQNFNHEGAYSTLILNQENGLVSPHHFGGSGLGNRFRQFIDSRQKNSEASPDSRLTIEPNVASALPHDSIGRGKSESGSTPRLFSRKKWLKHPVANLRV